MKKILYSAAAVALTMMMSGCSGFLDETPMSKFDESEAYKSSTLVYVNTVASLYNKMQSRFHVGDDDHNYMAEFTADILFLPGRQGDWVDGGKHQNAFLHRWDPSTDYIKNCWNNSYSDIALCNASLEKLAEIKALGTLEEKVILGYEAEVRAIRAFYYYWLVNFFGNIPIVTSSQMGIGDVAQSTRSEAYAFVRDELTAIIPNLKNAKASDTGDEYYARWTKAGGYAMLARLALNAAVFSKDNWNDGSFTGGIAKTEANVTNWGKAQSITVDGKTMNAWETVIYCKDQIAALGYKLEGSFNNLFKTGNEGNKEAIMVEPFDDNVYRRGDSQIIRSLHYNHAATIGFSSWNGTAATVNLLNIFGFEDSLDKANNYTSNVNEADPRFDISFFNGPCSVKGTIVNSGVSEKVYPEGIYVGTAARNDYSTEDYGDDYGLYVVKWGGVRIKKFEYDPTTSGSSYHNADRPYFRFAELLLMAAEAEYRLGNVDEATALVNQVRERATAKPVNGVDLQFILDEKARELVWETPGRRSDLVRHGLYVEPDEDKYLGVKHAVVASDWVYDATGYTNVFPIPVTVLSLNSNLKQNPGY